MYLHISSPEYWESTSNERDTTKSPIDLKYYELEEKQTQDLKLKMIKLTKITNFI